VRTGFISCSIFAAGRKGKERGGKRRGKEKIKGRDGRRWKRCRTGVCLSWFLLFLPEGRKGKKRGKEGTGVFSPGCCPHFYLQRGKRKKKGEGGGGEGGGMVGAMPTTAVCCCSQLGGKEKKKGEKSKGGRKFWQSPGAGAAPL